MSAAAAAIVDLDALWKIVAVGFAAGAGVVLAFGLVLLGRSRYVDAAEGDVVSRGGYLLLSALGAGLCVFAVVVGFIAMTKK